MRWTVITEIGWTVEYLDDRDFIEVLELLRHWRRFPPAGLLAMGYKPDPEGRRDYDPRMMEGFGEGRKIAEAPPHIRKAIEGMKSGK